MRGLALPRQVLDQLEIPRQSGLQDGAPIRMRVDDERHAVVAIDFLQVRQIKLERVLDSRNRLLASDPSPQQNAFDEVDTSMPCVWAKIWDQVDNLELLDELMDVQPPKDWSKSRGGGLRKVVRRCG